MADQGTLLERVAVIEHSHKEHVDMCAQRWTRLSTWLISAMGVMSGLIGIAMSLAVTQMNGITDTMTVIREEQAVARAGRIETERALTELKADIKDLIRELKQK